MQNRCPELLALGQRAAVQCDDERTDRLPGPGPDPGILVLPGDIDLAQLSSKDDVVLASGQLSKRG
jgi:hypothetical protein